MVRSFIQARDPFDESETGILRGSSQSREIVAPDAIRDAGILLKKIREMRAVRANREVGLQLARGAAR